ncbi:MAG TPA: 3D domain-containing protein [Vicinamibacterales bacterium]|jgi:3D (Asp-Asp-Asp) domain-containing protein|nr:3D domain-containing protein [Vicinamibacterales bacterium]
MSATAYCEAGETRSGARARRGFVAADPRLLPIGSRIRILAPKRYAGVYRVMDVGRGVKGRELDIFMPSCQHARTFGRRQVSVRVLKRGAEN